MRAGRNAKKTNRDDDVRIFESGHKRQITNRGLPPGSHAFASEEVWQYIAYTDDRAVTSTRRVPVAGRE